MHLSFIHTAGCHQELQWLTLQHNAEISPCAVAPSADVKGFDGLNQLVPLRSAGPHSPGIPSSSIQEPEAALH